MATQYFPPVEDEKLIQGVGVVSAGDAKVVNAAEIVAIGTGENSTVIATASESGDAPGGGQNALVGNESAVVDRDHSANDILAHWGYNAVAKVRLDKDPPLPKRYVLPKSVAFVASAQPDTGWQGLLKPEAGAITDYFFDLRRFPGLPVFLLSGDMVVWRDGVAHVPLLVDGLMWGLPLKFLGERK